MFGFFPAQGGLTLKIAVCPGSFDPVTFGHLDIIERSAKLFDHIYIAVLQNPGKMPLFSVEERLAMLERASSHLDNVSVETFSGLTVDYAQHKQANAIIRGLRAVTDFEFEFKLAAMNRQLNSHVETVFMMTCSEYSFLSSSAVKEVASMGGDVSRWVEPYVAEQLYSKFSQGRGESRT